VASTGSDKKSVVRKATRDIDEQAGALPGWSQEYCQIAKGNFSGNVDYRALPSVDLFIETTNLKHEQRFTPPPGSLVIGLALPGSEPVGLGSRILNPGSVMLLTGRPNEFYCAGHARVGAIVLERDALLQRRMDLARIYPEAAEPAWFPTPW
jgi:hypothetical protein